MNEVPELVIGGLKMVPVILGLVVLARKFGMDVKYAPWLNGVLSVLFYAVTVLLKQRPDLETIAVTIASGLLLFLVNAGVYDNAGKKAIDTASGK